MQILIVTLLVIITVIIIAPNSCNSLPNIVTAADSLASFKPTPKTRCLKLTFKHAAKPVRHVQAPLTVWRFVVVVVVVV